MEIKLCGVGGQGLGFAGRLLGEAAIQAGLHVAQTTSYGVESRGGMSTSDVIISEGPILFPEVRRPDILLLMAEKDLKSNLKGVHSETIILFDPGTVGEVPNTQGEKQPHPFLDIALQKFGSREAATIIGLGALVQISGAVPFEALEEAVKRYLPPKVQQQNLEALNLGKGLSKK
jgi:2-oxoglutarate ferredoxin oxidoreductase subunit gamma